MKNEYVNKITKLILALLTYFYSSLLLVPIFKYVIKLDFKNNYNKSFVIYDFAYMIVVLIIGFILYHLIIKNDYKKCLEEIKKSGLYRFLKTIFLGYVLCLLMSIFASSIESILALIFNVTLEESDNQNIIASLLKDGPILMIVSTCVLAPLVEEIIFRCGIRQVIEDKRVFITVSGLIFGLMHVTESVLLIIEILIAGIILNLIINSQNDNKIRLSVTALVSISFMFMGIYFLIYGNLLSVIKLLNPKEIIVSISYILMGCMLSLIYVKYDNIWINILVHALNNTISVILLLSLI